MKLFVLCLLATITLTNQVILAVSDLNNYITTPGYSTSLAGFHNAYHPNMLGTGGYWIWNNEGRSSPPGRTLTFEILFYAECTAPLQLKITADDKFQAYIDDKLVASGNNWRLIYSSKIDVGCGSHNLTIIVTQATGQYGPGLIYSLSQDQSTCFNCGLNGIWDYSKCQCSCLTACGCAKPQVWMDYPACACRCPVKTLGFESTTQQIVAYNSLLRKFQGNYINESQYNCPKGQYYNHQSCSCQCKPQYCPPRWRWNPDLDVCRCVLSN